jgi:hypothetical protein
MANSSSSSSSELTRSISIRKSPISQYVEGRTQGYRVRLEVCEARLIPAEIFVHQRRPATTISGSPIDEFSNVASPADLEEYPAFEPDDTSAFFRLSYVDLVFRSLDLLNKAVDDIMDDIRCLVESLEQIDELSSEECITITGEGVPEEPCVPVIKVVVSTRDPTPDDDITQCFEVGSWWINRITPNPAATPKAAYPTIAVRTCTGIQTVRSTGRRGSMACSPGGRVTA